MTNLDDAVSEMAGEQKKTRRQTAGAGKIILLGAALQAASWRAVILGEAPKLGGMLPLDLTSKGSDLL